MPPWVREGSVHFCVDERTSCSVFATQVPISPILSFAGGNPWLPSVAGWLSCCFLLVRVVATLIVDMMLGSARGKSVQVCMWCYAPQPRRRLLLLLGCFLYESKSNSSPSPSPNYSMMTPTPTTPMVMSLKTRQTDLDPRAGHI